MHGYISHWMQCVLVREKMILTFPFIGNNSIILSWWNLAASRDRCIFCWDVKMAVSKNAKKLPLTVFNWHIYFSWKYFGFHLQYQMYTGTISFFFSNVEKLKSSVVIQESCIPPTPTALLFHINEATVLCACHIYLQLINSNKCHCVIFADYFIEMNWNTAQWCHRSDS